MYGPHPASLTDTVSIGSTHFINLIDYTIPEMILFAGGCLLWVAVYAILIRNDRKYRIIEMPVIAGCSNFAWEILWSGPYSPDTGQLLVWTYRAWLLLDVYIFYKVIVDGDKFVSTPFVKRNFKVLTVLTMLSLLVLYNFYIMEGYDTPIGAHTAYIAQLFISVYYLLLIFRLEDVTRLSYSIAWLRTLGTAMNTVFMFMHYTDHHFLQSMGVLAFVMDMIYIWFLHQRKNNRISIA
ncbi:MAG: hypothetical protein IPP94_07580 [Ignavibacteria bacterium]|nr:hypothetical protein [Ignavibacteria bacterium]